MSESVKSFSWIDQIKDSDSEEQLKILLDLDQRYQPFSEIPSKFEYASFSSLYGSNPKITDLHELENEERMPKLEQDPVPGLMMDLEVAERYEKLLKKRREEAAEAAEKDLQKEYKRLNDLEVDAIWDTKWWAIEDAERRAEAAQAAEKDIQKIERRVERLLKKRRTIVVE